MQKLILLLLTLLLTILVTLLSACQENSNNVIKPLDEISLIRLHSIAQHASAHWLSPQLIVVPKSLLTEQAQLISIKGGQISTLLLTPTILPNEFAIKFPHLAKFQAFHLDISSSKAKSWLKTQLVFVAFNEKNDIQEATYLQTGAVIDALYTSINQGADEVQGLGSTITNQGVSFKLWAPTALSVELVAYQEQPSKKAMKKTYQLTMIEDKTTGIWQVQGESTLKHSYYRYLVTVYHPKSKKIEVLETTDPYSLSLSINSKYSQVVDLNDGATQPLNWQNHTIPTVKNSEDNIFYETHIRDFSANDSLLSDKHFRGKYKAFSEENSYGIQHLKALKSVGLNNIHLLPTFDIATVNEDGNQQLDINDNLAKACQLAPAADICQQNLDQQLTIKEVLQQYEPSSSQAQQLVSDLRQVDNYNWGYDPYHYTVPEGSYALNPQGISRLVEFREMVQSLHQLGFRVIMDVVYNHTHQSGLAPNAVLDKIVPNYYHRLDPITGEIEQSTCCDNTATERVMMAKLMTDSLVVWARDYKIDGFRFDLMGHQPKSAMLKARQAVRTVDSDTYFYGEGWNFGEVANNSQFTQASQLELGGSEIGTYSDRLRDAVRGSGNNTRTTQGIGNGLLTQANELQNQEKNQLEYNLLMDQLRIGLAGNLANFPLTNAQGEKVLGKDIPYGDQPTGYALDPADTINYVSKHDNQTLWDNSQYRLAFDVSTDDRVRMHLQSLSFTLFAQGIPFLHMGAEFMRSKSFLRDSYDYGDWFNRVDFSKQDNFYNVGLPPAEKDSDNWPLINKVIAGHEGRDLVSAQHINFSSKVFKEFIALRTSSPLFRLTTADAIIEKVSFLNTGKDQQLGLLVMKIDDSKGQAVDNKVESLLVIFNTSNKEQIFSSLDTKNYQLHAIQKKSIDNKVQSSQVLAQGFSVPALTSAVFVRYE
jgi:pullulanase-type alpha-1,6-glucosidase